MGAFSIRRDLFSTLANQMDASMPLFRSLFMEHPASVGETYVEHFISALGFGSKMIIAGIACMIHGLLPALFVTRGSDTICALHERMVVKRCKSNRGSSS